MGDIGVLTGERREQYRNLAVKRWKSWGASYEEAVTVIGKRAAEELDREEPLSEEELYTLPDAKGALSDLLHPGRITLDAIKAVRQPEVESS